MGACRRRAVLVDVPWPRRPDQEDLPGSRRGSEAGSPAGPLCRFRRTRAQHGGSAVLRDLQRLVVDEEVAANLLDPNRYARKDRVGRRSTGRRNWPGCGARTGSTSPPRPDEIATLRPTRQDCQAARRRINGLGPSQAAFGKFHERYLAAHGEPPPNDTGWTANRFGSRYRQPSHAMPSVTPAGQLS